jgi:putative methionine-R-sulfoxide reductase with GAF domain
MTPPDQTNTMNSENSREALEALLDFVGHVNRINSIESAIWHLAQHTIRSLGFEDCVVYLLDDDQQTLVQVAAYGPKNPKKKQIANAIRLKVGQGIVGRAAKNCESILIEDTRKEPNYVVDDQPRLSELAVPIHFHGKILGIIDSENSQSYFFTELHRRYLEILGCIIASKMTFNMNMKELEHSYHTLQKTKKLSDTFLQISELTYNSI